MIPYLCTPKECYNEIIECYEVISYCEKLGDIGDWKFPDRILDLDEIEIYSSYGGGFYWKGKGSELIKMIKESITPFDDCYEDIINGMPKWAIDFEIRVP